MLFDYIFGLPAVVEHLYTYGGVDERWNHAEEMGMRRE